MVAQRGDGSAAELDGSGAELDGSGAEWSWMRSTQRSWRSGALGPILHAIYAGPAL